MTERRGCFGWVEIGRAEPDAGAPWTVWMALLPTDGALYRTLVDADEALTITVEFQQHHGTGMRTLHKGHRYLPPNGDSNALANALLTAAEQAARSILTRSQGAGSTRAGMAVLAEAAAGRWAIPSAIMGS